MGSWVAPQSEWGRLRESHGLMKGERNVRKRLGGFTLIELLIVVAIIAILAAIAVPNFLEAQTRSKIARIKADERSLGTALESYAVDYNAFPPTLPDGYYGHLFIEYAPALTTPVAYITSGIVKDPFTPRTFKAGTPDNTWKGSLSYFNYAGFWQLGVHGNVGPRRAFMVASHGPAREWSYVEHYPHKLLWDPGYMEGDPLYPKTAPDCLYDATNGVKSYGGIPRFGGDMGGIPQTPN